MLEYGINNVRGAMFSQPRDYTMEDVRALTGFFGHYNDLDYNDVAMRLEQRIDDDIRILQWRLRREYQR
jgi:hypothetical protein